MIIRSLCNTCFQPYELLVQVSEIELMKQLADEAGHTAPCPRLCGGRINLSGDPTVDAMRSKLRDPINLTGTQLYQAVNGMGLPDEVPRSVETIEALLKANKVLAVDIDKVGDVYVLNELHLEGGIVVHLCGSGHGARVLRITKEKAHVSPEPPR